MQEAWNVARFSTQGPDSRLIFDSDSTQRPIHSYGEFGDPTTVARARYFCGGSVWLLLTGFSLHS